MIYEIINKGKGIITSLIPSDLLLIEKEKVIPDWDSISSPTLILNKPIIENVFTLKDEGSGKGVFLKNRDVNAYGNIGEDAFDISYNDVASTTHGATGTNSFASGINIISSGYVSNSLGYLINNAAIGGFVSGLNLKSKGYSNAIFGIGHDVKAMNATVVGQAANIVDVQILDHNNTPSEKPMFIVGNGTIANDDDNYTVLTRSNALEVMMDGMVIAPSLQKEKINSSSNGKVLVTKEWVQEIKPYKVYTALVSQVGANDPNAVVLENTLGDTITWVRTSIGQYISVFDTLMPTSNIVAIISNNSLSFLAYGVDYVSQNLYILAKAENSGSKMFEYMDGLLDKVYVEIRVYPPSAPLFTSTEDGSAWLDLDVSGSNNQIVIGYSASATDAIDAGYDNDIFPITGTTETAFWSIIPSDPSYLAQINGFGLPFFENKTIDLGYYNKTSRTVTISLDHTDGFMFDYDIPIILVDKLLGVEQNLIDSSYAFVSDAGTFTNRFTIKFKL